MRSRIFLFFILLLLFAIYYSCTSVSQKQDTASAQSATADTTALCGEHPSFYKLQGSIALPLVQDIPGFKDSNVLIAYLQDAADSFSWKTFIALNWPATTTGAPDSSQCFASNNAASTVWQTWMPSADIFETTDGIPKAWPTGTPAVKLIKDNMEIHDMRVSKVDSEFTIFDAEQYPVVDTRHMYTLFENYYNHSAYDYVVKAKLYSKAGQTEFSTNWPNFTTGLYPVKNGNDTLNVAAHFKKAYFSIGNAKDSVEVIPGLLSNRNKSGDTATYTLYFKVDPGAIIIKSAWVVLVPEKDDLSKYLTRTILVKTTKKPKPLTLGLVGMHIMHKVAEQTQWVWSSFEHIDNAPLLDEHGSARLQPGIDYLYFDESKNDTSLYNKRPFAQYQDSPFARVPTQVVQLKGPQQSTMAINDYFHALIRRADNNSKWLNYRLIGTQWAYYPTLFTHGTDYKPALLANPVLETYIQATSSCMNCHGQARFLNDATHYGYDADFVWELANVK